MQTVPTPPPPPPVPDVPQMPEMPTFWTPDDIVKIVLISIAGVAVVVWLVARGPIGHAIGEGLRRMFGAHRPAAGALPGELDELRERVAALQQQLGELAERQDFAERMLAQVRREKALPGQADVAG